MHLILTLHEDETTFMLKAVTGHEYVIGRYDGETGTTPDIDLDAFDGYEQGVSRRHAVLFWKADTCYLQDAGSVNGTFVNGAPLAAFKATPLSQDDWIQIGSLVMRFRTTKACRS